MYHYSVSGNNKTHVKARLAGRGFSVRHIVVLSHGYKASISWLTSNWQPAQDFKLEKVIVRYVQSMLSTLHSLCLALSGWGMVSRFLKTIIKRQREPSIKKVKACDGGSVIWCTSIVTVKVKQKGKTDIAHLSRKG